jgi:uncharacterized protein
MLSLRSLVFAVVASSLSFLTLAGARLESARAVDPPPQIAEIQGAAHISPKNGQLVTTTGIVSALKPAVARGFWIQDPTPDTDERTSEGIFVFTNAALTVARGDSVRVVGRVSEFRPGGSGGTNNLTITELVSPTITVVSSGNAVPAPTVIGIGGRMPPTNVIEDDATGDVEVGNVFDPAQDGIDFYESLESMIVQVNNAAVVGPTKDFGEFVFLPDNGSWATGLRTPSGGILYQYEDGNPERLTVDDEILRDLIVPRPAKAMVDVNVGDRITSPIVGPLDYTFANFKIQAMSMPLASSGDLRPEVTLRRFFSLAVATFNVENLDPRDPQSKFDALAEIIVDNLKSPDLLALEEVQDNNGAVDTGETAADLTLQQLVDAISASGGPSYTWEQIDPRNDEEGGEPGGNIRVAFLIQEGTPLSFVERDRGASDEDTDVVDGATGPELTHSPGRVEPDNAAWAATRVPLAGEFTFGGQKVFVVANHWSSKGGDESLFGPKQPPFQGSEAKRVQQAQVVNNFVDEIYAKDADANVVVLGDLNDFEYSDSVTTLTDDGAALLDLPSTLPDDERYTYVFDGNSQVLDHIAISNGAASQGFDYDVVHVNAEFNDQASDHDPQVVRLSLTS